MITPPGEVLKSDVGDDRGDPDRAEDCLAKRTPRAVTAGGVIGWFRISSRSSPYLKNYEKPIIG